MPPLLHSLLRLPKTQYSSLTLAVVTQDLTLRALLVVFPTFTSLATCASGRVPLDPELAIKATSMMLTTLLPAPTAQSSLTDMVAQAVIPLDKCLLLKLLLELPMKFATTSVLTLTPTAHPSNTINADEMQ